MKKEREGFSLLELLIVITLIGILAGIAIIRYGPALESARRAEAYAVLTEIVTAEKRYYLDNNSYTTTITDLDSFDAVPASANFTFSVPSADASTGYAEAARSSATGGRLSYGMCLQSGRKASCAANTCNPGCP
jgi:type IV pilus assembly protein PilE